MYLFPGSWRIRFSVSKLSRAHYKRPMWQVTTRASNVSIEIGFVHGQHLPYSSSRLLRAAAPARLPSARSAAAAFVRESGCGSSSTMSCQLADELRSLPDQHVRSEAVRRRDVSGHRKNFSISLECQTRRDQRAGIFRCFDHDDTERHAGDNSISNGKILAATAACRAEIPKLTRLFLPRFRRVFDSPGVNKIQPASENRVRRFRRAAPRDARLHRFLGPDPK